VKCGKLSRSLRHLGRHEPAASRLIGYQMLCWPTKPYSIARAAMATLSSQTALDSRRYRIDLQREICALQFVRDGHSGYFPALRRDARNLPRYRRGFVRLVRQNVPKPATGGCQRKDCSQQADGFAGD